MQITTAGQNEPAIFFLFTCHIPQAFPKLFSVVVNPSQGGGEEASPTPMLVHVFVRSHAGTEPDKNFWFWAESGGGQAASPALASPTSPLSPIPLSAAHCLLKLFLTQLHIVSSLSHSFPVFPSFS